MRLNEMGEGGEAGRFAREVRPAAEGDAHGLGEIHAEIHGFAGTREASDANLNELAGLSERMAARIDDLLGPDAAVGEMDAEAAATRLRLPVESVQRLAATRDSLRHIGGQADALRSQPDLSPGDAQVVDRLESFQRGLGDAALNLRDIARHAAQEPGASRSTADHELRGTVRVIPGNVESPVEVVEPEEEEDDDGREALREMLRRHEGVRREAYTDTMGHRTVGVGFNLDRAGARERLAELGLDIDEVRAGRVRLRSEQIETLLEDDIDTATEVARRYVDNFDELPQEKRHVITDMALNLGEAKLSGFQKLKAAVEAEDWDEAGNQMENSRWYEQVKTRGVENVEIMRTPPEDEEPDAPEAVPEGRRSSLDADPTRNLASVGGTTLDAEISDRIDMKAAAAVSPSETETESRGLSPYLPEGGKKESLKQSVEAIAKGQEEAAPGFARAHAGTLFDAAVDATKFADTAAREGGAKAAQDLAEDKAVDAVKWGVEKSASAGARLLGAGEAATGPISVIVAEALNPTATADEEHDLPPNMPDRAALAAQKTLEAFQHGADPARAEGQTPSVSTENVKDLPGAENVVPVEPEKPYVSTSPSKFDGTGPAKTFDGGQPDAPPTPDTPPEVHRANDGDGPATTFDGGRPGTPATPDTPPEVHNAHDGKGPAQTFDGGQPDGPPTPDTPPEVHNAHDGTGPATTFDGGIGNPPASGPDASQGDAPTQVPDVDARQADRTENAEAAPSAEPAGEVADAPPVTGDDS